MFQIQQECFNDLDPVHLSEILNAFWAWQSCQLLVDMNCRAGLHPMAGL